MREQGDDMSRFMAEYLSGRYPAGYWEWVAGGMDEVLSDRARHVRDARTNTRLSGGQSTVEARNDQDAYVDGRLDVAGLLERLQACYGKEATRGDHSEGRELD